MRLRGHERSIRRYRHSPEGRHRGPFFIWSNKPNMPESRPIPITPPPGAARADPAYRAAGARKAARYGGGAIGSDHVKGPRKRAF